MFSHMLAYNLSYCMHPLDIIIVFNARRFRAKVLSGNKGPCRMPGHISPCSSRDTSELLGRGPGAGSRHSSSDSRSLHRDAQSRALIPALQTSSRSAGSLRYVNLFRRPDQYHASSLDLDSHLHAPLLGEERAKGSVTCDAGRPVFFVTQPALPRAA